MHKQSYPRIIVLKYLTSELKNLKLKKLGNSYLWIIPKRTDDIPIYADFERSDQLGLLEFETITSESL